MGQTSEEQQSFSLESCFQYKAWYGYNEYVSSRCWLCHLLFLKNEENKPCIKFNVYLYFFSDVVFQN